MIPIFALSHTRFQIFELVFLFLITNISLHPTDADSTTQVTISTPSVSVPALDDVSPPTQNSDITQSQIIQAAIGVSVTVLIIGICVLYCYLYGKRTRRIHTRLSPGSAYIESVKRLEESSSETRRRFYEGEVDRPSSTQLAARPSIENPGAGNSSGGGGGGGTITAVGVQNFRIGNSSLASVNTASEYNVGATPSLSSIELQASPIEVN